MQEGGGETSPFLLCGRTGAGQKAKSKEAHSPTVVQRERDQRQLSPSKLQGTARAMFVCRCAACAWCRFCAASRPMTLTVRLGSRGNRLHLRLVVSGDLATITLRNMHLSLRLGPPCTMLVVFFCSLRSTSTTVSTPRGDGVHLADGNGAQLARHDGALHRAAPRPASPVPSLWGFAEARPSSACRSRGWMTSRTAAPAHQPSLLESVGS